MHRGACRTTIGLFGFIRFTFFSIKTVDDRFRLPQTGEIRSLEVTPVFLVTCLASKKQIVQATLQAMKVSQRASNHGVTEGPLYVWIDTPLADKDV